jgi:anti-sigma regulatory factor (Ser/Thr protein kinase)
LLPRSSIAPGLARQHLLRYAAHLPEATLDAVLLMTSELVTNAVKYGGPGIVLNLSFDPPHIAVHVYDGAQPIQDVAVGAAEPVDVHGRGLFIVSQLSTNWGVTARGAAGKDVWFEIAA